MNIDINVISVKINVSSNAYLDDMHRQLSRVKVDLPDIQLGHISLWHHFLEGYEKMADREEKIYFVVLCLKSKLPQDIKKGLIWHYQFDECPESLLSHF